MRALKKNRKEQRRKEMSVNEELTNEDIKELMGIDRPTYRRGKGGAFRQRGGTR